MNIKEQILTKYTKTKVIDVFLKDDDIASYINSGYNFLILKTGDDDKLNLKKAHFLRELSSIYNCLFVIEKRADIAKLSSADGILLDELSLSANDISKIIDKNCIIFYRNEIINE
ncbi:thiamine phosphate synthase [bacterium]|nr:thiamine phosphate synthase [bacterium]